MNIKLKFKNINECNGVPKLAMSLNDIELFKGPVQPEIDIDVEISDSATLKIVHFDKNNNTDVQVQDGVVIADKNCELDDIIIDGYNIEELKWRSVYITEDNEEIKSCLFFGKNGHFEINFEVPVLRWMLKTRHEILNNDPSWEQDYESYTSACRLIHKLN